MAGGTVTNLLTDAAVGGMVCNFRDVTERKRAGGPTAAGRGGRVALSVARR